MVDMKNEPSDLEFKLYDWNKVLKNKKLGESVLSFKSITTAGSYHKLNLGSGNGTLLVFVKLFTSGLYYHYYPRLEPSARILFDSSLGIVARPDEVMRIGYILRIRKNVRLSCIHFDISQRYSSFRPDLVGCSYTGNEEIRCWSVELLAADSERYKEKMNPLLAHPLNVKHKPYGSPFNNLPQALSPGIHYFHVEFTYPSRDKCGRFIGSGSATDVETRVTCGIDVQDESVNDDSLPKPGKSFKYDSTPIFLKSDFPFHLKPSLPPIYDPSVVDESTLWLEKVKITWDTPKEGRNRTSPLPPHLYNPEVISDEDRQRWYLPNGDTLDAHGQERIYANLTWALDNPHANRVLVPHFLILSHVRFDASLAQPEIVDKPFKVQFGVRLVCDRFTVSGNDKSQSVRNTLIYDLKPTNKDVGRHKREYEIVSDVAPIRLIYSLPEEMYGHLQTSYVYVEVVAINTSKPEEVWVLQRRPIFVEQTPNFAVPTATPIEPTSDTGSIKVGYAHYEFLDRPLEVVGDFDEPVEAFGPDRLVRLMVPASAPDGSIIDDTNFSARDGSFNFTDALAKPEEVETLLFRNMGVPTYRQDTTMNEPASYVSAKVAHAYSRR